MAVICLLCGYEGAAHEAGSVACMEKAIADFDLLEQERDAWMRKSESAEADANRLAEALEVLGDVRADCDCGWWHAGDCPHWDLKVCELAESEADNAAADLCAETCRAARKALDKHKEQVE